MKKPGYYDIEFWETVEREADGASAVYRELTRWLGARLLLMDGEDAIVEHYPVGWRDAMRRIDRLTPAHQAKFTAIPEVAVVAAAPRNLEPCAPLALPAVQPAAYVPKVGDYVTWGGCHAVYRIRSISDYVIVEIADVRWPHATSLALGGTEMATLRPATAEERTAAGLGVSPAPPVDREGLAKALRLAEIGSIHCEHFPWDLISAGERETYTHRADAAIAFLWGGAK